MAKILIVILTLGMLAVTSVASYADVQYRPCIKSPKDNLPCIMTVQSPQQVKPRSR